MSEESEYTTLIVKKDVARLVRIKAATRSIKIMDFTDLVLRCGLEQLEKEAK